MSVSEIMTELQGLPPDDRRQLAAFLVTLRHRDLAEYRAALARKIDDTTPENWLSLEEYDQRLAS